MWLGKTTLQLPRAPSFWPDIPDAPETFKFELMFKITPAYTPKKNVFNCNSPEVNECATVSSDPSFSSPLIYIFLHLESVFRSLALAPILKNCWCPTVGRMYIYNAISWEPLILSFCKPMFPCIWNPWFPSLGTLDWFRFWKVVCAPQVSFWILVALLRLRHGLHLDFFLTKLNEAPALSKRHGGGKRQTTHQVSKRKR